jgi:transcriptional regulator with PAS, ATPase and Fis domain
LLEVFHVLERIAATDCTVLIQGESGTGKELAARALHLASPRHDGPFIPVNCAAIPETLIESELFGHTRGAFSGATRDREGSFAAADGGTLFLDEIGELSPAAQAKLLRVLQDGEISPVGETHSRHVDVRIVTATNGDLELMAEHGEFRSDLFYRARRGSAGVSGSHRGRDDGSSPRSNRRKQGRSRPNARTQPHDIGRKNPALAHRRVNPIRGDGRDTVPPSVALY